MHCPARQTGRGAAKVHDHRAEQHHGSRLRMTISHDAILNISDRPPAPWSKAAHARSMDACFVK
jgi:hypothetical protein